MTIPTVDNFEISGLASQIAFYANKAKFDDRFILYIYKKFSNVLWGLVPSEVIEGIKISKNVLDSIAKKLHPFCDDDITIEQAEQWEKIEHEIEKIVFTALANIH